MDGTVMGAELVGLVYAGYADLPGNQFKVLGRMALSALDYPSRSGKPARVYTAGWQPLSLALGRDIHDLASDSPESLERRRHLRHEISKIWTALKKADAIRPLINHPQSGQQQVWSLVLERSGQLLLPVDISSTGPAEPPSIGG
jgi:hypothetical protein